MNSFPSRSGNIPYAFNPSTNHQIPVELSAERLAKAQDRLIVGVDFGTTYSGAFCEIVLRKIVGG